MASNYNQKSNASASRKGSTNRTAGRRSSSRAPHRSASRQSRVPSSSSSNRSVRSSSARSLPVRQTRSSSGASRSRVTSVRVGDLNQSHRTQRVQKSYRRYVLRIVVLIICVLALIVGGFILYNSSAFTLTNVTVKGVDHLTASEMTELASVPAGTTLLRVDEAGIKSRLSKEPWVKEVTINRVFPDTLEIDITERSIAAIVEVPVRNTQETIEWAIAAGGMWLMKIPSQESSEAQSINSAVYEDAASALHINKVPDSVIPEAGTYCSDASVINALSIIDGLTTSLADQIQSVSATGAENTTLYLQDNLEIAFGAAEDIREKERVCLGLMEAHPNAISYINVRVVDLWASKEK